MPTSPARSLLGCDQADRTELSACPLCRRPLLGRVKPPLIAKPLPHNRLRERWHPFDSSNARFASVLRSRMRFGFEASVHWT